MMSNLKALLQKVEERRHALEQKILTIVSKDTVQSLKDLAAQMHAIFKKSGISAMGRELQALYAQQCRADDSQKKEQLTRDLYVKMNYLRAEKKKYTKELKAIGSALEEWYTNFFKQCDQPMIQEDVKEIMALLNKIAAADECVLYEAKIREEMDESAIIQINDIMQKITILSLFSTASILVAYGAYVQKMRHP